MYVLGTLHDDVLVPYIPTITTHNPQSALHEQQAIHQQLITQRDLAHAACQAARHDAQRAQHAWQQRVQQQQEEVEAMAAALNDARDALQVKHVCE